MILKFKLLLVVSQYKRCCCKDDIIINLACGNFYVVVDRCVHLIKVLFMKFKVDQIEENSATI